jgi:hypothetical protein
MGFFDRMKNEKEAVDQAQEMLHSPGFEDMIRQSQEMYAQMTQGGGLQHLMEQGQRASKLVSAGVPTPAVIKSVAEGSLADAGVPTGAPPPGFGPAGDAPTPGFQTAASVGNSQTFTVEVQPEGKPAYEAKFTQMVAAAIPLQPGTKITVRVDPDDPHSMMFWGMG